VPRSHDAYRITRNEKYQTV